MVVMMFELLTVQGTGQTFSFVPAHTHLTGQPESDIAFEIPIVNLSNENLSVCVLRRVNNLPGEWSSSFCFDVSCFPPFIDSVATTPDFQSTPITPGTSANFSIHVFPDTTIGIGQIQIVAKNLKNLNDSITVDLTASNDLSSSEGETTELNKFNLYQNYPNPFNPSTIIAFYLDREADINITLYDALGNKISTLMEETCGAGINSIDLNADGFASGIYFYRVTAKYGENNIKSYTKKMILEK